MKEYVFIIRFGVQATLSPEQQKHNTENWTRVIDQWKQQGNFIGSSLTTQPGFLISNAERSVKQGFVADTDFRVTSLIRISATNLDDAVELAKACPTLDFGGTVEVREVQPSPFR